MTANCPIIFSAFKKYIVVNLLVGSMSIASVHAQINYDASASCRLSGMGVERVAMYFTPAYESKLAQKGDEVRWVQLDLGAHKNIDGFKLLPKPVVPGSFIQSQGFPTRFKIEVSDDSTFQTAVVYEDQTRTDFKDPYDEVVNFSGKEVRGRYVRLTATRLRQQRLALTKLMVLSKGKDIAEGCPVKDSATGKFNASVLTRPRRPQGEGVVTNNPGNVIPVDQWKPVAYKAQAPDGGLQVGDGLFRKTMENNIGYLLSSITFDDLVRNFYLKAGKPVKPLEERLNNFWMVDIPGSEAGRFLMGAGNTLRWIENTELRKRMDQVVDAIEECKEPDGYIMAYAKDKIFTGEYGAYTRSWVTHGLIEAGYAGNKKAFPLLRGFYDWFDASCYLPELLRRGGQGTQGLIPNTRMYFTPVGKPKDLAVVQQYFQENYWLEQLAKRDQKAIWLYPYDRPHSYLLTGIEPYLDLYRATGAKKYFDAALGGWDLYHNDWEHIGGSIAICEGYDLYPPKSYYLHRGTGELCGNVFWSYLNQRFHLLNPDEEKYVAEIEKSIYNVVIANQAGAKGIRYGARLVEHKGSGDHTSTCCEGQGTRMMGALPEFIYAAANDGIYVDLFSSSTIRYATQASDSMSLSMATQFPYDPNVKIEIKAGRPAQSKIRIRVPSWAANEMAVLVNGKKLAIGKPGTYVAIDREWKTGDEISFRLPMKFKMTQYTGAEEDPDRKRYAVEYGPLLMAFVNMKDKNEKLSLPVDAKQLLKSLRPIPGKPLHYTINGADGFEYMPYYEVQNEPFTCFP
jgi:uncharacterized protein